MKDPRNLASYFDAPAQERMRRSTSILEPTDHPRNEPFHIVSAHPTSAHRAFVDSNARHNGLTLLASFARTDGWTTVLYRHPALERLAAAVPTPEEKP